jgi:hypothetical protein
MSARSRCGRACRSMPISGGWHWPKFYPLDHRGRSAGGTAATFDLARAGFEAAWKAYLPLCTEADFAEHRRQRAWTAWKYAMHDAGRPLPTQASDGRARCFCGAAIDIPGRGSAHSRCAHDESARGPVMPWSPPLRPPA